MNVDRHTSIWEATTRLPQCSTLTRDMTADVVIIGAGITGLTAAVLLKAAGRKVIVLEAEHVGAGTSGHTTAHLTNEYDYDYYVLEEAYGIETAKLVWRAMSEAIDTIEKMVKEYDIKVGFHDHPRQPNKPTYRMWDPYFILELTKGRDERIGACADTGHWQTSGLNPLWAMRLLKGRIISSHLKDKADFGRSTDVPYGEGVGEIGRILEELKAQGFDGNISIEYESNWEKSLPEVTKCVEFVRDWKSKK